MPPLLASSTAVGATQYLIAVVFAFAAIGGIGCLIGRNVAGMKLCLLAAVVLLVLFYWIGG